MSPELLLIAFAAVLWELIKATLWVSVFFVGARVYSAYFG